MLMNDSQRGATIKIVIPNIKLRIRRRSASPTSYCSYDSDNEI